MPGHISLGVRDLPKAAAFYDAALACLGWRRLWDGGPRGVGYGPPGLRPHYGATYDAAFVVDPDGHRLEAVVQ